MVAFYTQVSDTLIGGTYMTLLNTLGNIGKILVKLIEKYLTQIGYNSIY